MSCSLLLCLRDYSHDPNNTEAVFMKITSMLMSGCLTVLAGITVSYAQTAAPDRSPTIDSDVQRTAPRERAVVDERVPPDRTVVQERVVERRPEGELYVAGFGGFTLGHSFANV